MASLLLISISLISIIIFACFTYNFVNRKVLNFSILLCIFNIENYSYMILLLHRLGGGAQDAVEVKSHPFFATINWDDLYERKVMSGAVLGGG